MSSVGGMRPLKDWFAKRGLAFTPEARAYGLAYPKGILLMGPPGTGKSLMAKALGSHWGISLLRVDMGSLRSSLQGESEHNLHSALKLATSISPSILWIDEVEKAFAGAEAGNLDSGVGARILGSILTWMQETASTAKGLVDKSVVAIYRTALALLRACEIAHKTHDVSGLGSIIKRTKEILGVDKDVKESG